MSEDLFINLEDKGYFCKFVRSNFEAAPKEITGVMHCKHDIDDQRIEYAYAEYMQSIKKFAVFLHSENPDHYKRAGALLYALNKSAVVTGVDLESSSEELKSGFTRLHVGDAVHVLPIVKFYEAYHNQMLSFDLAYRCCAAYEDCPTVIDFDYEHNVCRYLKCETNLSLDACFILFKSLMLQTPSAAR